MNEPGHASGREARDAARSERDRLLPQRRAAWAAVGVAAANGAVVVYAVIAIGALVVYWLGHAVPKGLAAGGGLVAGVASAVLLVAIGTLLSGTDRVMQGAHADGQGVHLGLLLGAAGAGIVAATTVAVGPALAFLTGGRVGQAVLPCGCVGAWPALIAVWNVYVLVRHGHRFRRDDVPGAGLP
jgi:hypothetical protein